MTRDNVIDLHNILQGIQQKFAAMSHIANVNLLSLGENVCGCIVMLIVAWDAWCIVLINSRLATGTMQQVLRQVWHELALRFIEQLLLVLE